MDEKAENQCIWFFGTVATTAVLSFIMLPYSILLMVLMPFTSFAIFNKFSNMFRLEYQIEEKLRMELLRRTAKDLRRSQKALQAMGYGKELCDAMFKPNRWDKARRASIEQTIDMAMEFVQVKRKVKTESKYAVMAEVEKQVRTEKKKMEEKIETLMAEKQQASSELQKLEALKEDEWDSSDMIDEEEKPHEILDETLAAINREVEENEQSFTELDEEDEKAKPELKQVVQEIIYPEAANVPAPPVVIVPVITPSESVLVIHKGPDDTLITHPSNQIPEEDKPTLREVLARARRKLDNASKD